jgi:hypothetical protein
MTTYSIELKYLKEAIQGKDLSYLQVIQDILRTPQNPQVGVQIDEMRKSVRVLNELETLKDNDILILAAADYEYLKERVTGFKFTLADKALLEFVDYIASIKAQEKEQEPDIEETLR